MGKNSWIEYAMDLGIPPFDAADLVLDVTESLTEDNLQDAFKIFAVACESYLAARQR